MWAQVLKKTTWVQTLSKYSITQNYASEVENLMFLHEGRHTYFANISEPLSFQNSCARSRCQPGIAFATRLLLQELPSSLPRGWSYTAWILGNHTSNPCSRIEQSWICLKHLTYLDILHVPSLMLLSCCHHPHHQHHQQQKHWKNTIV